MHDDSGSLNVIGLDQMWSIICLPLMHVYSTRTLASVIVGNVCRLSDYSRLGTFIKKNQITNFVTNLSLHDRTRPDLTES